MEPELVLGAEEERLVNHRGSVLIVGRSGTGKTTVLMSRLFRLELLSRRLVLRQQQHLASLPSSPPLHSDHHSSSSSHTHTERSDTSAATATATASHAGLASPLAAERDVLLCAPSVSSHKQLEEMVTQHVRNSRLRQLMMTQSEELCAAFEQYFARLARSQPDADVCFGTRVAGTSASVSHSGAEAEGKKKTAKKKEEEED